MRGAFIHPFRWYKLRIFGFILGGFWIHDIFKHTIVMNIAFVNYVKKMLVLCEYCLTRGKLATFFLGYP